MLTHWRTPQGTSDRRQNAAEYVFAAFFVSGSATKGADRQAFQRLGKAAEWRQNDDVRLYPA
ncbi:MAG: hypothetical protein KGM99_16390 [Burkholderiales bacterium]|nr:hypothetical protein [Burkholderiales bacterium]